MKGEFKMEVKQTIINVLNTLNGIEVSGRQNLDRLLGSMVALEKVIDELSKQEAVMEDDGK